MINFYLVKIKMCSSSAPDGWLWITRGGFQSTVRAPSPYLNPYLPGTTLGTLLGSSYGKTLVTPLGSTFGKALGTPLGSTFGKTLGTPLHMWIRNAPNPTGESDTWALQQFFKKTSGWCPHLWNERLSALLEINTNVSIMLKIWFPKCYPTRNRWGVEAIYGAIMVAKLIIRLT